MISLRNVSRSHRLPEGRRVVLDDVSVDFPPGRSFGILGVNGAGKSTLIRLLAGVELRDRGSVRRRRRVSFPLGFGGTFHPRLSGRENVLFLARLYGADARLVLRYVEDFAELGAYFAMPVGTYSSGMRARLAFGACLAIEFDLYLIDEVTAVGDARFQARCQQAFEARIGGADIIMVSHSMDTIRTYCDAGGLIGGGRLTLFDSVEDAIADHAASMGLGADPPPGQTARRFEEIS